MTDVEAIIDMLKLELAAAHRQSYEARLELQRLTANLAAAPPQPNPAPAPPALPVFAPFDEAPAELAGLTSERARLSDEVDALERARTALVSEIAQREAELQGLTQAIDERRSAAASLAHALIEAVDGPGAAVIDLTGGAEGSVGDRDLDAVLLPVTGSDQRGL